MNRLSFLFLSMRAGKHAKIDQRDVREGILTQRDHILQKALCLPPEDRAYVAAALEQSLSPPEPTEESAGADLLRELQTRSSAYRAKATTAKGADEVLGEQRQRQAREANS